ncbi:Uncharacterised protein [Candidatus Ornithobacterium hominis]|uniref:Uncharacterized protein n=1 Tax=Candidatus Ornithobacterium hominis TaxID=2497989 RepID=A0A383U488_9FLAO|nr:Uncharacterised protein [Candidatus Ornithobacterium hominis]
MELQKVHAQKNLSKNINTLFKHLYENNIIPNKSRIHNLFFTPLYNHIFLNQIIKRNETNHSRKANPSKRLR